MDILNILPYNPGVLPKRPAPKAGDSFTIEIQGLPPYKDRGFSIRNIRHPRYDSFVQLREKAIEVMDGRAWYRGPVSLDLVIFAPRLPVGKELLDYMAGIFDSLDGSSGPSFTYLPIAYEDDCQCQIGEMKFIQSVDQFYKLTVTFLDSISINNFDF